MQGVSPPAINYSLTWCVRVPLTAVFQQVVHWLDPAKPLMLIRFLGTSPDSSAIIPLLTNLCKQIDFHHQLSNEDIPEEMSPLVQHFKNLLTLATEESPIVIFLDSLDQLSPSDGAYQLAWLPVILPPHVKIVVSTLPNYHGIIESAKRLIESEENYIEITPLGEQLAATVMQMWLARANRTVSDEQWRLVSEVIRKCNVPLFIKLVFDEICRWRSNLKPQMTTLADSIHNSVIKLFDRIENQHGKVLVSHAFGYITAAKSGLSEAELEDLLSLDEKVLNDVYQYHLPPVRRIPPLLWTRIRNDLPNYFAEREADGVNVIFWYHRQFIEASKERYFRNLNFLQEMHSLIADYFLGIWGGGVKKPFEYSELQRQRFFLDSTKGAEDRKVPEQPLCFRDTDGKVTRHNLRKLSELPFHLLRAHRFDDLYKEVLCNFRWLHAKLSCMPLQSVLVDFEEFLEVKDDRDIKLLADALRLSASVLSRYPEMVGPQIVGRLLPYYSTNEKIQLLIHQCDTDGLEVNALSPSFHCMHTPGGPLQYSLEGHPFAPFGVGNTSDTKYLVSVSNVFIIWDLTTGDVFRQINPSIQGIMQNLKISPDDKHCVSYTNNNQVIICSVMTGDYIIRDKKLEKGQELVGATLNNTHVIVWSAKQWFIYTINGELVRKDNYFKKQVSIIIAGLSPNVDKDVFIVWRPDTVLQGVESEEDMTLEILDGETDQFDFHSAIAVTRDRDTLYACIAISDEAIACYKRSGTTWVYDRTLRSNYDKVFCLMLSKDEGYLAAMVVYGYKLWNLDTDKLLHLKLPTGVRNIPTKNQLVYILLEFTKNSEYLVAGVRKNLYVWDTNNGDLVKTLDAHFGRIIAMSAVSNQSVNKVISSSIDKTIKVWNFANIRENVFSIDRLEKPIEAVSLAAHTYLGATTTRNCVGIWNLENGKIAKTLANSAHSSIVTHSVLNKEASYLVSAESGQVLIWDVDKEKVIKQDAQEDVLQLFLTEDDSKAIAVSRSDPSHCKLACRSIPSGDVVYQFEYMCKTFRNSVVTADGLHIVTCALHKKTEANTLRIYHAKTGSFMYETTPKYNNYKEFHQLIAMPNEPNHVALIDADKGNFWDIKKKCFVRSIQRWNGICSSNGKYGLYAPNRGGLEMLDLKTGKTIHVMIPKVAEGVFDTMTLFTRNDHHVVYYHCGHRTIRVFRVADGKQIANYKAHAEIRAIESTQGGMAIVLGAVDGSLVVLSVADPQKQENSDFLLSLPSRQVKDITADGPTKDRSAAAKTAQTTTGKMASLAHVARVTAKAKQAQRSRACVLS
ncbi:hypothetical protein LSH36_143g06049 [Paralvinella palmiformis]|uniref:Uncharacterized protein n=1 Tax=Paralvinella palmiformis TaxID=53620 RepID=A0AAD9N9G4_9ANNE|nr:hypothetical protein LSH36_143g06049 [Paralvinella palmiformis]